MVVTALRAVLKGYLEYIIIWILDHWSKVAYLGVLIEFLKIF